MTQRLGDDENTVPISSSSEGSTILSMDTENCVHQQFLTPMSDALIWSRILFFRPIKPSIGLMAWSTQQYLLSEN